MMVCIICAAVCAFCAGACLMLAFGNRKAVDKRVPPRKTKINSAEDEKRRIVQAELNNFLNYFGDEMPDPVEVANRGR